MSLIEKESCTYTVNDLTGTKIVLCVQTTFWVAENKSLQIKMEKMVWPWETAWQYVYIDFKLISKLFASL